MWVLGINSDGQLGLGDTIPRLTPVTTFIGGSNWKDALQIEAYRGYDSVRGGIRDSLDT